MSIQTLSSRQNRSRRDSSLSPPLFTSTPAQRPRNTGQPRRGRWERGRGKRQHSEDEKEYEQQSSEKKARFNLKTNSHSDSKASKTMSTMDEIEQDFIEAWNFEFSSKVGIQKDLRQHLEMMRKHQNFSDNLPTSSSSENYEGDRYSSYGLDQDMDGKMCQVCQVKVPSVKHMEEHRAGINHRLRLGFEESG